jgi:thiopurine S-methyltransferase
MDEPFWRQKWQTQRIAFHQQEVNPLLKEHLGALALTAGSRVFVPLCGKTHDMAWLLAQGYRVVGVEWVEDAVDQFFEEMDVKPSRSVDGAMRRYRAEHVDLLAGDFFELSGEQLGPVDAVYDRAALVALPEAMRERYAAHLKAITACAPQLLLTYRYDPRQLDGPPFSIDAEEVDRHYGDTYDAERRASVDVPGGLKGVCPAAEEAWVLRRK